jgi:hypothetical protein
MQQQCTLRPLSAGAQARQASKLEILASGSCSTAWRVRQPSNGEREPSHP